MSARGLFVTGTDTGIGKTRASCALLHALRAGGERAVGMKPVASGCERIDGRWRNEDAVALQAAGEPGVDYALVNPYALPEPLAPELASARAGVVLSLPHIAEAYAALAAAADVVVVEGVGGWKAPLSRELDQADLVRALELPVLLVIGLRLGCINHARLSARAIADDGFRLVGWIGSAIDPGMAACEENIAMLAERLPAPCWGVLPWQPLDAPSTAAASLRIGAF
jgi:dethiobiotin synthetase